MEQVSSTEKIELIREDSVGVDERVGAVINRIRPYIQSHGGDVWVSKIAGNTVTLRIEGSCAQCPLASLTYNKMVKTLLTEEVPEITEIVLT